MHGIAGTTAMDAIEMDIPSDIESEFLQSGNTIAKEKEGLEAKLQAPSPTCRTCY